MRARTHGPRFGNRLIRSQKGGSRAILFHTGVGQNRTSRGAGAEIGIADHQLVLAFIELGQRLSRSGRDIYRIATSLQNCLKG